MTLNTLYVIACLFFGFCALFILVHLVSDVIEAWRILKSTKTITKVYKDNKPSKNV